MLDYEAVSNNSFIKDIVTDEIVNENLLFRFSESKAYLSILGEYYQKSRQEKVVLGLAIVNAGFTMLALPYLNKNIANQATLSLIQLGFLLVAMVIAVFILKSSLLFRAYGYINKSKIKALAIEQEPALKDFFLDFVERQVLPSVNQDFLADFLKSGINKFLVKTRSDDKDINKRSIVLAGLYGTGKETVEVAVQLSFSPNYSKLDVSNYHINQRIASSRFKESDDGC